MSLVGDFFVRLFEAVGAAVMQVIFFFCAMMRDVLPSLLAVLVGFLPLPAQVALDPYVQWIEAVNQWVPLSEAVVMIVSYMAWSAGWSVMRMLVRIMTLGILGR